MPSPTCAQKIPRDPDRPVRKIALTAAVLWAGQWNCQALGGGTSLAVKGVAKHTHRGPVGAPDLLSSSAGRLLLHLPCMPQCWCMCAAASGVRSGAIEQCSAEPGNEEITSCSVAFAIAAACDIASGDSSDLSRQTTVANFSLTSTKPLMVIVHVREESVVGNSSSCWHAAK